MSKRMREGVEYEEMGRMDKRGRGRKKRKDASSSPP